MHVPGMGLQRSDPSWNVVRGLLAGAVGPMPCARTRAEHVGATFEYLRDSNMVLDTKSVHGGGGEAYPVSSSISSEGGTMKKMMIGMTVAVLVLSTVICVSSLGSDGDVDVNGNSDFLVGEQGYSSFQDAIDAAKGSEEKVVKFNAEGITFSEDYEVYDVSGLTIDLNGKTISTGYMSLILMGTDFTFCNGTINTDTSYSIWIGDDPTDEVPTSKNVTVRGITTNAGVNICNSEDVTLSDLNVNVVQKEKEPYYAVWCDEDAHAKILSGKYASAGGAVLAGTLTGGSSLTVVGGEFVTRSGQNLVLPGNFGAISSRVDDSD